MSASELIVEQVGPAPDHTLTLARGVLDETTMAQLGSCVEHALDIGARYLVIDLSQAAGRVPAALPAPAGTARRPTPRPSWPRLVATGDALIAALDTTDSSMPSTSTAPLTEPGLRPDPCRPGMLISETGRHRAADAAVNDLREQVRALQTQLHEEQAETARLREEVAQLPTQIHENFDLNTVVAQNVTGRLSLEESVAEALSTATLLISRDRDATKAIAVLRHWRGASPEIDRKLISLMSEYKDVAGLRELAEDYDSTAAVRLAELLCERREIEAAISTLKPFAQRSHAASEFLVRLLVSQEDLPSLGELATVGSIVAAKELVELAVSRGSCDDLNTAIRALGVMERDVGGRYPIAALTRLRHMGARAGAGPSSAAASAPALRHPSPRGSPPGRTRRLPASPVLC